MFQRWVIEVSVCRILLTLSALMDIQIILQTSISFQMHCWLFRTTSVVGIRFITVPYMRYRSFIHCGSKNRLVTFYSNSFKIQMQTNNDRPLCNRRTIIMFHVELLFQTHFLRRLCTDFLETFPNGVDSSALENILSTLLRWALS